MRQIINNSNFVCTDILNYVYDAALCHGDLIWWLRSFINYSWRKSLSWAITLVRQQTGSKHGWSGPSGVNPKLVAPRWWPGVVFVAIDYLSLGHQIDLKQRSADFGDWEVTITILNIYYHWFITGYLSVFNIECFIQRSCEIYTGESTHFDYVLLEFSLSFNPARHSLCSSAQMQSPPPFVGNR